MNRVGANATSLAVLMPGALVAGSLTGAFAQEPAIVTNPIVLSEWRLASAVGFYAVVLTILVVFAAITIAVRQYIWTTYAAMGVVFLALAAANEQFVARMFFPDLAVSSRGLILFGHATATLSFCIAAMATARSHPLGRLRPVLLGIAVFTAIAFAIGSLLSEQAAILFMNVSLIASLGAHVVPLRTFILLDGGADRVAALGGPLLITMLVLGAGAVLLGMFGRDAGGIWMTRIVLLTSVLLGSVIACRHVLLVRRGHERALIDAASAAAKDAEMSRSLLDAERNYARARDIARRRGERLAMASHDIKQPLMSLRTTIDAITQNQPTEIRSELCNAFDYLEALASSYLTETQANTARTGSGENGSELETAPATTFIDTLDRMFRAEAEAKGLTFSVKSMDDQVSVPPLTLMRILSNLVSNAIKHTKQGEVALGAERTDKGVVFFVGNTGPALTSSQVDVLSESNVKGSTSDGEGLGLAIVKQLAQSAGLELTFSGGSEGSAENRFSLLVQRIDAT